MQPNYQKFKSTLSETSKDDDGNSVIISEQEVYNFDLITEDIANSYRVKRPQCSCDALYIKDDDNIYLIEFKNVRGSRVPKKDLKLKVYDSIFTLQCAAFPRYSIEDIKEKVKLVFVYNDEEAVEKENSSDAFDKIKEKMHELTGKTRVILFGLEIYKGVFYKDIITVDKQEFMDDIFREIFL